jgi:hypothetical protein
MSAGVSAACLNPVETDTHPSGVGCRSRFLVRPSRCLISHAKVFRPLATGGPDGSSQVEKRDENGLADLAFKVWPRDRESLKLPSAVKGQHHHIHGRG